MVEGQGGSSSGGVGLDMEADSCRTTTITHLPAAVMGTVLLKLDVPSLCSVAATSRSLHDCAAQALSFLPAFHLLEISPTVDLLRHLLPPNPYLRSLKLDCRRLDDSVIFDLARPSLEELSLFNCYNFSGRLLSEVGRRCRALRSLSVSSLAEKKGRDIIFSELQEVLHGCSQLESLSLLLDMFLFAGPEFAEIWRTASGKLASLEVSCIPMVVVNDLLLGERVWQEGPCAVRPPMFSSLQKLSLSLDCITDDLIGSISEALPSAAMDLTNAGLQQVNRRGKLKHLSLVRSQEYDFTYFKRVNDLGFLLLADTCPALESIRLGASAALCKLKVSHGTQLTDLLFHDISATSLRLTHVSLRRCNRLTDLAVARLSCNRDLAVVDLRDSRHLGDQALRPLAGLPKLQALLLDGTDISDWGLSRGCKRLSDGCIPAVFSRSLAGTLQAVDLSRLPNLSDNGILLLARSGAPIAELRLRNARWSGTTLRLLDLYESRGITQLAFRWLKKPYFPRLRWLGVTGSSNRDLVDALVRSRPFLNVACYGEELPSGHWDGSCRWYAPEEEEEEDFDGLEQWVLEGGDAIGEEEA
ncbi:unnamed protein product [Spirodela intermedia]|uniref:F-box/LRR-repeat protein 15-like leucin rich repeat domain-containing protein n=1 Tax=Spirodela intermedia TaxID=51605 RepID=A0A7I8JTV5_SPIIN|nr:unnamed protein product [Spirodela intermedia]CAA6673534.1 unnamed protein product [Spirodela intermedia]